MSEQISRENVLEKMHNYLHVWDVVGIINENVTDEEERNALLDVLEGAQLIIEQLEQVQRESEKQYNHNLQLSHELDVDSNREQIKMLSEHVEDLKAQLEQAQAANQKLVECLNGMYELMCQAAAMNETVDIANLANWIDSTLSEVEGNVGDS